MQEHFAHFFMLFLTVCFLLTFPNSPFLFPISLYFLPFELQYHPIHFMMYTLTLRTVQWVRFLYRNEYKKVLSTEGWQWSRQSWDSPLISASHCWCCELRNRSQGVSSCKSWCAQDPWRKNKLKNMCISWSLFYPPFLPLFFSSWDGVWLCFWDWPCAWCSVVFLLHSAFWAAGTVGAFHYPSCSCCFLNESWCFGDPAVAPTSELSGADCVIWL